MRYVSVFVLTLFFGFSAGAASAQSAGLTPNHVYGLWRNINDCIVAAGALSGDDALREELAAMKADRVSDKRPADVLEKVRVFRGHLDRLRALDGLEATRVPGNGDGEITPSIVFINSGYIRSGAVGWYVVRTDASQLVSPFYERRRITDRTLSHVFAAVDLATQRIERLLDAIDS